MAVQPQGCTPAVHRRLGPAETPRHRAVQHRFLQRLGELLPGAVAPIIVADCGFKVPFYREVERLGWRWVGRVRGRDHVRLGARRASCKAIFRRATPTPTRLGEGQWVRSNPLRAIFVLVRHADKGRRDKTANGKRARSKKRTQAARGAREPWLLVVSTRFATLTARKLVRLYRQRMQIELDLRNIKTTLGMARLRCKTPEMVVKELWVYLLAYNLIRLLMARAALLADQVPRQLSFKHAVPVWLSWQQRGGATSDGVCILAVLSLIAEPGVGLRPGRIEPRALKRRANAYPLLTKPRKAARAEVREHGHPKKQP